MVVRLVNVDDVVSMIDVVDVLLATKQIICDDCFEMLCWVGVGMSSD